LRSVDADDELIHYSVQSLNKFGFINYFGMQRFGSTTIPTFKIGIEILKNNWENVANLLLYPREGERADTDQVRKYYYSTHDIEGTIKRLTKSMYIEKIFLIALQKSGPKAYLNAFSTLPRNLRMLYLHAYQSYIWNLMASERIHKYGYAAPIIGDLVINKSEITNKTSKSENEEEEEVDDSYIKDIIVKIIETDEDVIKYTIEDVVLPLPGYNIKLPKNDIGEEYIKAMNIDGISLKMFKSKHKEYCVAGGYRRVIEKPLNLSYNIIKYEHPNTPLINTDLDKLGNKPEPASIPNGRYKAVCLTFILHSGTYATMAIRELLKQSTAQSAQKLLSQTHTPSISNSKRSREELDKDNIDITDSTPSKKEKLDEDNMLN